MPMCGLNLANELGRNNRAAVGLHVREPRPPDEASAAVEIFDLFLEHGVHATTLEF